MLHHQAKGEEVILMENLVHEKFVDMKVIERTSGGGVTSDHMKLVLEG